MAKTNSIREITIIVRYEINKDGYCKELNTFLKAGDVVLLIENDKGARYYTILRRGRGMKHSCTCPHVPSKKSPTCYHIGHCAAIENERAAQLAAQRKAREASQDEQEIAAMIAHIEHEESKAQDIATRGSLSSNRGFSLLKVG